MSNDIMEGELIRVGANRVIGKMNMLNLSKAIIKELSK